MLWQLKAKNKTRNEVRKDVYTLLAKLKLSEKKDFLPSKLSGGQQRRLCLGMALIGDANVCSKIINDALCDYYIYLSK